ncbi:hypothetical protein DL93DRAFT_2170862 [Clavulina sp. PMI_390]|nr:hypothetical protein DL93DRAFT_2170862 [Clavulina sp. PMI_390]
MVVRDLPPGWIKEHDIQSDRDYFVDTLANPPRSSWVHPLDDPEFMRTHKGDGASGLDESNDSRSERLTSTTSTAERGGVLGNLEDKTVGTKVGHEQQQEQHNQQTGDSNQQGQYYARPPMDAFGGPTYKGSYALEVSPNDMHLKSGQKSAGVNPLLLGGGALLGGLVLGELLDNDEEWN